MSKRVPNKTGGYTVNVSFRESESKLLEHADEQGNFSAYIKSLIARDMQGGATQPQAVKHNNTNVDNSEIVTALNEIASILKSGNVQLTAPPNEVAVDKEEHKPQLNRSAIMNIINK